MNKLSTTFFLASLVFIGCETVIDVDIPLEPAKLVINSTLIAEQPFRVHLSSSQHILDNSDYKNITGAAVKIYEDGQLLTTLPDSTNGMYISDTFMPKAGKQYRIEVEKNGFDKVTADEMFPEKPAKIVNIKIDTVEINDFGYIEQRLEFDIGIDDSNDENYYELIIIQENYYFEYDYSQNPPTKIDSTLSFYKIYLESNDPSLEEFQNSGQSIFFDDGLFNGKKYRIKVSTYFNQYPDYEGGSENIKYMVVLRNTSESYYLYKRSTELQKWTEDDPFAQPVQVYNNINNGYGIFAGYNDEMIYEIELE